MLKRVPFFLSSVTRTDVVDSNLGVRHPLAMRLFPNPLAFLGHPTGEIAHLRIGPSRIVTLGRRQICCLPIHTAEGALVHFIVQGFVRREAHRAAADAAEDSGKESEIDVDMINSVKLQARIRRALCRDQIVPDLGVVAFWK